jgi:hypothetical protein
MNATTTPTDIWARRDKAMPRRARDFQVHHPGTYSRKRVLDDSEAIEIELNRRESLAAQIKAYGSLRTL